MSDFTHKDGRGTLFKSDREGQIMSGSFRLDGRDYWLNVWKKDEGKEHWGVSVKAKNAAPPRDEPRHDEAAPDHNARTGGGEIDDEIPFSAETR